MQNLSLKRWFQKINFKEKDIFMLHVFLFLIIFKLIIYFNNKIIINICIVKLSNFIY